MNNWRVKKEKTSIQQFQKTWSTSLSEVQNFKKNMKKSKKKIKIKNDIKEETL